jgi:DNA-binding transcriptional MerR regulator
MATVSREATTGPKLPQARDAAARASRLAMQASDFAARAGISVRTLHHYDRLGLLKPVRSAAGYRLYSERDFARLQQIVTLKFIGLPLRQIREFLDLDAKHKRNGFSAAETFRVQRRLLELKRNQINSAIAALTRAERMLESTPVDPGYSLFCEILEVIAMHNNTEWEKVHAKYFTEEQRADMARRADPELAAEGTRKWTALISEVEAAAKRGEDPTSEHARDLARRWDELCNEFVRWAAGPGSKISEGEVKAGLSRMYSDRKNWPGGMKPPFSDEAMQFISAAQKRNRK